MPTIPLPNLPTDNLYKFLSLFGIVIIILSTVFPALWEQNINEKFGVLSVQENEIVNRIGRFDSVYTKIVYINQKQLKDLELRIKNWTHPPKELMLEYIQWSDSLEKINTPLILKRDSMMYVYGNTVDRINHLLAESEIGFGYYAKRWKYGLWTGIIITFFGFLLWYIKVQRYQDRILKKESNKPQP